MLSPQLLDLLRAWWREGRHPKPFTRAAMPAGFREDGLPSIGGVPESMPERFK
jgi:hypothetical protein